MIDVPVLADIWKVLDAYDDEGFAKQRAFVNDRSRFSLAGAAVRTGKTYGAGVQFVSRMREDLQKLKWAEPKIYWCLAPTYEETIAQKREIVRIIPPWMVDTNRQGDDRQWKDLKRGGGKLCLWGNVEVQFRTAEHPERLVADKVRGVWWTEIARSKYAAWPNVRGRLSNYDDSWLVADTSPFGRCWFYVEIWEPALRGAYPGACCHEWTAEESPWIPASEIENARATLPDEFFRRDYMADWSTFSGQIYSEFKRDVHMVDVRPFRQARRSWIFIDENVADKPACFSVATTGGGHEDGLGNKWDQLHIESEYSKHIMGDLELYADDIARAANAITSETGTPLTVIIDPSASTTLKNLLRARKINPRNGVNKLHPGIRALAMGLHPRESFNYRPLFTMSESCNLMANEFEGYSWKRSPAGVTSDKPDKDALDPHLLDGVRYGAMHVWSGFAGGKQVR